MGMSENVKLYNADQREVLEQIKRENCNVIIVTDPPFNIGYHYRTYKDRLKEDEYYSMLKGVFIDTPSVIIHYPEALYKIAFAINKTPDKVISWVYNSNTAKQHRDIAFFDVKPNMKQVLQPYKNPTDKRIKERIKKGIKGGRLYDWWNVNQVKNTSKNKTIIPCQMPLEVMENIVGILPLDACIVDPFMGSGTTGLAVVKMNEKQSAKRKFIGVELDKEYFAITKTRLEIE